MRGQGVVFPAAAEQCGDPAGAAPGTGRAAHRRSGEKSAAGTLCPAPSAALRPTPAQPRPPAPAPRPGLRARPRLRPAAAESPPPSGPRRQGQGGWPVRHGGPRDAGGEALAAGALVSGRRGSGASTGAERSGAIGPKFPFKPRLRGQV